MAETKVPKGITGCVLSLSLSYGRPKEGVWAGGVGEGGSGGGCGGVGRKGR